MADKFKVGDKVICQAHFAGVIEGIEKRIVSGQELRFYVVRIPQSRATMLIPTDKLGPAQPRRPISRQEVEQIYQILGNRGFHPTEEAEAPNRRYQRYQLVLTTGSLAEIAGLLKALHERQKTRGSGLGEARVIEAAMDLLVGEVTSAGQMEEEAVRREIELRLEAN
ncbi:MAG: CarD family transcriptional regulator [bacterium]